MLESIPNPLSLVVLFASVAFVPFLAVMMTSFVKLAIVMSLVRNALGLQQIPPNSALYGLAIIMTVYIMAPIGTHAANVFIEHEGNLDDVRTVLALAGEAVQPFRLFLKQHAHHEHIQFFMDTTTVLWPEEYRGEINEDNFFVLIPAFTISELTEAFVIGFLLYLPFVVIDLVISNILLAMGMMMVSPMTISLPFKLFLFVLVDGWTRLIQGLVLSYQ